MIYTEDFTEELGAVSRKYFTFGGGNGELNFRQNIMFCAIFSLNIRVIWCSATSLSHRKYCSALARMCDPAYRISSLRVSNKNKQFNAAGSAVEARFQG